MARGYSSYGTISLMNVPTVSQPDVTVLRTGASLNERDPAELKIPEFNRWLQCIAASV